MTAPDTTTLGRPAPKGGWYYATVIIIAALITVIAVANLVWGTADSHTSPIVYTILGAIAIGAPDLINYIRSKT